MKVVRKILFILFCILFGFLLFFNVYQFVCVQLMGEKLATINGYAVLEVVSGSMEPTIHVGDLIVIDTKKTDFNENDIVTFTDDDGSFVTHRIIALNNTEMTTKGDNNNSNDPVSSTDSIVGTYVFRLGGMGILLSSLRSPFIMFMIFVVGILVCYFLSLDKEGNLILDESEKEYQEFLDYKKGNTLLESKKSISGKDNTKTLQDNEKIVKNKVTTTSKNKKTSELDDAQKKKESKKNVTNKTVSSKKNTETKNIKKVSTTPKKTSTKKSTNSKKTSSKVVATGEGKNVTSKRIVEKKESLKKKNIGKE